ncbi:MAG TPA: sulfur carrier protein ThiS [Sorangium sp.]|nr:sulfur carrier protein ThiS [Sorangium sp.]
MSVRVNGDSMTLPAAMTVAGLVKHLGLHTGPVAVERNGAVVTRAQHAHTALADGDDIEIVHFVGGG